jgi:hypothetical protein
LFTSVREDHERALADVAVDIRRLREENYRSPDEAFAALLATEAKLNAALFKVAQEAGGAPYVESALRSHFAAVIREFIDAAKGVGQKFAATECAIAVGSWPPSVTLTVSWRL